MIGWLKLHRKILESNMYKSLNSKQRDVMFVCLITANHEQNEWVFDGEKFQCEAGQVVTSLDTIAKYCGKDVKVQSVRTALLKLEKWGFLTNKSTKTGRLITICKWDEYQPKEKSDNKAPNKDLTKSQQRPNKDLTSIEEEKNEKNEKNEKKTTIPTKDEFIKHAEEKAEKAQIKLDNEKVILKYEAWKDNDWKDYKGKEIKNWKLKLTNTIPYLKSESKEYNYEGLFN